MSNYFFSADLHLGHENIIKYCNRPFDSLEEMDATIIKNWNERVKPDDTVLHVGDFAFRNSPGGKVGEGVTVKETYYEKQLNGKVIFLQGNHDRRGNIRSIISSINIFHGGKDIHLIHNPQAFEPGKLNLCGHVHEKWHIRYFDSKTPIVNVGVDVNDFRPITINEILRIVARNPYKGDSLT